jgi:hypothetical protein
MEKASCISFRTSPLPLSALRSGFHIRVRGSLAAMSPLSWRTENRIPGSARGKISAGVTVPTGGGVMEATERIVILDFGSQYTQVIARRIRETKVYSDILPFTTSAETIRSMAPSGIILSGGPASVYSPAAPMPDPGIFELDLPMLGICYGMQLLARFRGGKVARGSRREYGQGILTVRRESELFHGLPKQLQSGTVMETN